MVSKELLKGSLKAIVLKLLAENGRMYGYEITRKVEELSGGKIQLTFGALYPILHKLEDEGVVVTESENVNNRTRIYYQLTPKGNNTVLEKVTELREFLDTLNIMIQPQTGLNYV
jgi:PadR family transcriptional regulator, regulatory protein PadR